MDETLQPHQYVAVLTSTACTYAGCRWAKDHPIHVEPQAADDKLTAAGGFCAPADVPLYDDALVDAAIEDHVGDIMREAADVIAELADLGSVIVDPRFARLVDRLRYVASTWWDPDTFPLVRVRRGGLDWSSPPASGGFTWGAGAPDRTDPVVLMREAARMLRNLARVELADTATFNPGDLPELLDRAANDLTVSRYPEPPTASRLVLARVEVGRRLRVAAHWFDQRGGPADYDGEDWS